MSLSIFAYLRALRRARGFDARSERRYKGSRRLFVYGLFVCALIGLGGWRRARAHTREGMVKLGSQLLPLASFLRDAHTLDLNGERLYMASATTDESMPVVMDRIEQNCRQSAGPHAGLPEALARATGSKLKAADLTDPFTVVREAKDDEGVVLCLTRSKESPTSIFEALKDFAESRDLSKLGNLRYAYVRRSASRPGGAHVLFAWTEGSFSFEHIMPKDGSEPPGTDSSLVPRPPGSKRLLSASVTGTPFAVRMYHTNMKRADLVAFYASEMSKAGWVEAREREEGQSFLKEGVVAHVAITDDKNESVVSLGEAGETPSATPTNER